MFVLNAVAASLLLAPATSLPPATPVAPTATLQEQNDPPIPADGSAPVTTASGLTYSVLAEGDASAGTPALGDEVTVHYTGWLEDGTVFDSSRQARVPGQEPRPATFKLGRVIEGWNEGLTYMSPGSRLKLTIPPELGYGDRVRNQIPANATLIFDVELISFEKGPELPTFQPLGETAVELESGVRVQVLKPSDQPAPEGSQLTKFRYAFWNTSGRLIDCSEWTGSPIRCSAEQPPEQLAFLTEAMPFLGEGAVALLEVPQAKFGQGAVTGLDEGEPTIWRVETLYVAYPPEMPAFQRPSAEAEVLPESGARYEVLEPGVGEPVGDSTRFRLAYTYWDTAGQVVDSTLNPGRGPVATTVSQLRIPFMQELLPTLAPGAVALTENVAAGMFGGKYPPGVSAEDTLVWRVEVVDLVTPLEVPEFRLPNPETAVTTDSGLLIETLVEGRDGPAARKDQRARVHYAGWLAADGTLFDNTFELGVPADFGITQVIPGWTETLLSMQPGQTVLVRIPWDQAYGEAGSGTTIPPRADLVFLVQLIDFLE